MPATIMITKCQMDNALTWQLAWESLTESDMRFKIRFNIIWRASNEGHQWISIEQPARVSEPIKWHRRDRNTRNRNWKNLEDTMTPICQEKSGTNLTRKIYTGKSNQICGLCRFKSHVVQLSRRVSCNAVTTKRYTTLSLSRKQIAIMLSRFPIQVRLTHNKFSVKF